MEGEVEMKSRFLGGVCLSNAVESSQLELLQSEALASDRGHSSKEIVNGISLDVVSAFDEQCSGEGDRVFP